jgi:hypothetical protein
MRGLYVFVIFIEAFVLTLGVIVVGIIWLVAIIVGAIPDIIHKASGKFLSYAINYIGSLGLRIKNSKPSR